MKIAIDRLQKKVEQLVVKHQEVKSINVRLKERMEGLQMQLEKEQQSVLELQDKNKILTLSTSLHGKGQGAEAARKQINELVREIDKCIALLNK